MRQSCRTPERPSMLHPTCGVQIRVRPSPAVMDRDVVGLDRPRFWGWVTCEAIFAAAARRHALVELEVCGITHFVRRNMLNRGARRREKEKVGDIFRCPTAVLAVSCFARVGTCVAGVSCWLLCSSRDKGNRRTSPSIRYEYDHLSSSKAVPFPSARNSQH